jgi:uncharacterized protein (DUF2384 family)
MRENHNITTSDELVFELREFFANDEQLMNEWINTPLPILEGYRPFELFDSVEGREKLVHILGLMKHGDTA